jgi:hypothetical protein
MDTVFALENARLGMFGPPVLETFLAECVVAAFAAVVRHGKQHQANWADN